MKFQLQLECLPSCCAGRISPRLSLPREGYSRLACIWKESFPTRAACVWEAEDKMRTLYREAEQVLEKYSNPISPDSFLVMFQEELTKRLPVLKELLGKLRTPDTAAVVNRINALLSPDGVLEEMARFHDILCAQYTLEDCGHYLSQITYHVSDPSESVDGIWKLATLAFRRYGYDLLPAVHALEADGIRVLEELQRAFSARAAQEINRRIISPVQDKLPMLRALLNHST